MTEPITSFDFSMESFLDLAEQPDYEFPHPIQRYVVPLFSLRDGVVEDHGSAFFLCPGVLMTAGHNVNMIAEDWARGIPVRLYCIYLDVPPSDDFPGDALGGEIEVRRISLNRDGEHDVALLSLNHPYNDDGLLPVMAVPLALELPAVGTQVLHVGYSDRNSSMEDNVVTLDHRLRASNGVVQEVLPDGIAFRGIALPVVQTNHAAPGGMSGGPFISERGVFGLMSSGFGNDIGDGLEPVSFASSLLPALDLKVNVRIEGDERDEYTLRELIDHGLVAIAANL